MFCRETTSPHNSHQFLSGAEFQICPGIRAPRNPLNEALAAGEVRVVGAVTPTPDQTWVIVEVVDGAICYLKGGADVFRAYAPADVLNNEGLICYNGHDEAQVRLSVRDHA